MHSRLMFCAYLGEPAFPRFTAISGHTTTQGGLVFIQLIALEDQ